MPKWTTIMEYVDLDTGEIISKKIAIEQYIIINKTKKHAYNESKQQGTTVITNECKRSKYRQPSLFGDHNEGENT